MEHQECLESTGLSEKEASVLLYFFDNKDNILCRHVEHRLDLRQPEVSLILKDYKKRGWVSYTERRTTGKGRPTHIYKLKKPKKTILNDIVDQLHIQQNNINDTIEKLESWK